jgi:hypothetical protein
MGEAGSKGRMIGRVVVVAMLALVVCSCGYHLVNQSGIYGGDIKTVSLSNFKNVTYEPHASLYVTKAFSQEIVSIGLFELNAPNSDAYLDGTIRRITILPSSMDANGLVIEKQATMIVELSLYRKNGTFIKKWEFADSEPYRVDDVSAEDYNKRNAFEIISGRIARKFTAVLLVDY